jgi:hypothetical protein
MVFVQLDAAIVGMMTNVIMNITDINVMNVVIDLFRPITPNMFGGPSCSRPLQEYQERDNSESPYIFFCFFCNILSATGHNSVI